MPKKGIEMIKSGIIFFNLFLIAILLLQCTPSSKDTKPMHVYVGTYTEADSQGIELYTFNRDSGKLHYIKTFAHISDPSYLRLSRNKRVLYAVNERIGTEANPEGTISAFAVDAQGYLTFINSISSEGRAPCYLSLSENNRFLLVNNYLDGKALSVKIHKNGALAAPVSVLQFSGSGPNRARQDASHVHSINPDPQNYFALIADLGTDKLSVYRFNSSTGTLSQSPVAVAQTAPGAGPRHTVFSADGKTVFVANELNSTVDVFRFNPANGALLHVLTIPTIPREYKGKNYPADIHLSPDGRFLYVSNRGHESIAVFSVDSVNSEISFKGTQSVLGSWPRNFVLSKDGNWLLVANQKSRNIVVFRRNQQSGLLTKISEVKSIAVPACLVLPD